MSLSSNLENYIETGDSNIFMFKTDLADECYVYISDSIKELVFDNNSSEDCNFDDDLNKIIDSTAGDLTDAVVVGLSKFLDVK